MPEIDRRFLTVHPRTVLWWEQRKQCEHCTHRVVPPGEAMGLRCGATKAATAAGLFTRQEAKAYCIDAREPGQPCGPDGLLFTAKEAP